MRRHLLPSALERYCEIGRRRALTGNRSHRPWQMRERWHEIRTRSGLIWPHEVVDERP